MMIDRGGALSRALSAHAEVARGQKTAVDAMIADAVQQASADSVEAFYNLCNEWATKCAASDTERYSAEFTIRAQSLIYDLRLAKGAARG